MLGTSVFAERGHFVFFSSLDLWLRLEQVFVCICVEAFTD